MPIASNRRHSAHWPQSNTTDDAFGNARRDQHIGFTAVLKAIEFECRLKREWLKQQQSAESGGTEPESPSSTSEADSIPRFFEHFVVCGLPPDADVVAGTTSSREAKNARHGASLRAPLALALAPFFRP